MSTDLVDLPAVGKDEILWRRIPSRKIMQTWYAFENGEWRPTSIAFIDRKSDTNELSAYVASETKLERIRADYLTIT